jgi:hypothetical protein
VLLVLIRLLEQVGVVERYTGGCHQAIFDVAEKELVDDSAGYNATNCSGLYTKQRLSMASQ